MSNAGPADAVSAESTAILNDVKASIRAGQLARATDLARHALEKGKLVHPLLLHLRAHWLEEQGRIAEAIEDLRQAVLVAPYDPLAHFAYGEILVKTGDARNAVIAFETTARLRPDYVPAYRQLGFVKCQMGESEAGRSHYEKAVALDPKDADSLAGLAELAQRRGDYAEARALIDRTFALNPDHPVANIALAALHVAKGALVRADSLVRKLLANGRIAPPDHAIVMGILGDVRHAQKRYGEAFEAYTAAAAEKRKLFAPQYDRPGRETSHSYAIWLADYLQVAPAAAWQARRGRAAAADGARGHVFLVGFPRSGTTLLHNILVGNPRIAALQEQGLLFESTRDLLSNDEGRARLAALGDDEAASYADLYWQRVRQHGVDVRDRIFVDTHPLNSMKLPLAARIFPDAKVVFAIRDPRDVVFSCFRRPLAMGPSTFEYLDIERAARFYDAVMSLSLSYRDALGLDWLDLRHENLVDDFEAQLDALCGFVGIEKTADMRGFAELARTRKIQTASAAQVKRRLNRDGIGLWRNYRRELEPIQPILRPWVERFLYPGE